MADLSLPTRVLDFVTETIPRTVIKHPVATAAAAGLLYGAHSMRNRAYRVEDTLRAERMGSRGSQYAPEDLHKFSEVKEYLEVKCAYEKTAGPKGGRSDLPPETPKGFKSVFMGGLAGGIGSGVASKGMQGVMDLLSRGAQSIHDKLIQDPKREKIYDKVMAEDPLLSSYEANNPGVVLRHYQTLVRFAPTLSTDPNVVTSYLRATAPLGGSMDPTVIKGLAEAEKAVHNARSAGRWGFGGRD